MALTWDKALFDRLYSAVGWRHGIRGAPSLPVFRYHWFAQQHRLEQLVDKLMAQPDFASRKQIAIIGGGYGWTAELLAKRGITAISIDTSPHINSTWNTSEEGELRAWLTAKGFDPDNLPTFMSPTDPNAEMPKGDIWKYWLRADGKRTSIAVMDEDLSTAASRARVRSRLPALDCIFTENCLDAMTTDAEAIELGERVRQLRGNDSSIDIAHLVTAAHPKSSPLMIVKSMDDWRSLLDSNGFSHQRFIDVRR